MRVLVVEDEPELRARLVEALGRRGLAVDATGEGREGLFLAREIPYDVAVVDLGLPDLDGLELIRTLRAEDRPLPVLILTARGRWDEKVAGLEAGADDYLVKPFHMEELVARLNALVRRAAGWSDPVLRVGPLEVDTRAQRVRVEGREVELTAFEYRLLEQLVLRAGEVLSKSELTEHLYAQDFDRDSNTIEVFVARLRRKLDPEGRLRPIETLRGQGYRLAWRREPA
ncbi:response regulator transcription factor [Inmirania thermothiophila]|uniref:Two-component system response regulator PhoP n=1 Tax=Inmirania thermothiophila TaxID=1750597 RepID=A0A3N1Y1R6_9GAMM|nr:response regulator transcription factor [Inmirania thermothiophila]ROR32773.1 two-component system response regulator PhoP [Inmirania thermothiophila]